MTVKKTNNISRVKIVLIEDDPFLSSMYSLKFKQEGFNVFLAADGVSGVEVVTKELPDLILLDIMMPRKNGFDVLFDIKNNKKTKNIPVILLTNINQVDEVEKGMKLGAVDYLIKAHFMPSEVVDKIKKILNEIKR